MKAICKLGSINKSIRNNHKQSIKANQNNHYWPKPNSKESILVIFYPSTFNYSSKHKMVYN